MPEMRISKQQHLGYNVYLKSRIKHHEPTVNFYVTHAHVHIYIYETMAKVSQTIFSLTLEITIFCYFSHWKVVKNVVMMWSICFKQINDNTTPNQTDKEMSLHLTGLLTWWLFYEYYTLLLYKYS